MAERKQSAQTWAACKAATRDWPRPGLVALVQELYQLSDENRRFLHARLLTDQSAQSLDEAKRKLKRMLSADTVFNSRFRHADIKRFIDQYAKACDDPAAVADLLLTDLETAFATFNEVGDDEVIVDHLYATLSRLEKAFKTMPNDALAARVGQLDGLASRWGASFGWGISDQLCDVAEEWKSRIEQTGDPK